MIQTSQTAYRARDDATLESEVSALAAIYKLAISSHASKEATGPGSPDDAKERSKDDSSAKTRIP
jgi:hypothetical protein